MLPTTPFGNINLTGGHLSIDQRVHYRKIYRVSRLTGWDRLAARAKVLRMLHLL